nr:hypothetical protein [uncultured Pseudomonas sp.]
MSLKIFSVAAIALILSSGCAVTIPKPPAEHLSGYTYIPVDPFSVKTNPGSSCESNELSTLAESVEVGQIGYKNLLESLPDNAVRMSIEQFFKSGAVTYGTSKVSGEADSYRVTVDYINADTTNVKLWIRKFAQEYSTGATVPVALSAPNNRGQYTYGSEIFEVLRADENSKTPEGYEEFNLPVYVGIGLRVTANIESAEGAANISGLGAIGAEAEAKRLQGSLTVQTLGVNGQAIAAALPIQSELNRTTAQNAIVAVGSIKALLYEDGTVVVPRVVGLYLPFPGGKPLVNAIISELSKERVVWNRPCVVRSDNPGT